MSFENKLLPIIKLKKITFDIFAMILQIMTKLLSLIIDVNGNSNRRHRLNTFIDTVLRRRLQPCPLE